MALHALFQGTADLDCLQRLAKSAGAKGWRHLVGFDILYKVSQGLFSSKPWARGEPLATHNASGKPRRGKIFCRTEMR